MNNIDKLREENRDPISGEPGAHPIGTGLGAASGGVAGAAIGAIGGPIGMTVGAAIGAIAGGLAGKSAAEAVNPTDEDAYWQQQYPQESYYSTSRSYPDFASAYRLGYSAHSLYPGQTFETIEEQLEREYNANMNNTTVPWSEAKYASRAAWNRVARGKPGYAGTAV